MADLARAPHGKAKFSERKHSKLLNAPLESSGFLIYTPPNRLEKRTVFPRTQTLIVDNDRLTLESPRQRRVLKLQEQPAVWAFVESIRATLKGDLATLERFYRVSAQGAHQSWQLVLTPKQQDMQALVRTIKIDGSRNQVNSIEIEEADGDRSVMTVAKLE
jgi:outer membrane lipoprotein-sorting protein